MGFENKAFDEMHIAGQVAKHLNIKHRPLYFRQKDYFRIFDKVVSEMDQPYADPSSLPTFLKFEYCRDKAGAFLDGTGADGIMGDLPPRQKIFAARYAKYLPGTLRKMMVRLADKNKFVSNYRQIFDFDDPAELFIRWKGYKKEEIQQLCNRPVSFAETTFFKEFDKNKKLSPLALYGALLKVMSDDRIHQSTRPYELNLRFPFWDTQIKAYVRLFDESYKYDFENMKPKKVLRMIFGRYVPSRIWDFPKHGFNFPLAAFLHAYMDQIVHRYLTTPGELFELGRE